MMKNEVALEVKDLHISYKLFQTLSLKKHLLKKRKKKKDPYFEAVRGVTFSMEKGNIVGIIGKNGSGKSTLLNAIAGIFAPDSGSIDLKGNSVSLLSIGVGFQRELSGRENILLSGMLLGFSKEQIAEKEQDIIDFAGLGAFIDRPVKTYSSGMHSKLAFSITAMLETDIILIDEVLSVGDIQFRKKSYEKMKEIINDDDKTVVIVSHSTATLLELCTSVIWLNDGQIRMHGNPEEVVEQYELFMTGEKQSKQQRAME